MTHVPPRFVTVLLVSLALTLSACTSQREHRAALNALDERWDQELGEDDYPELLEHVHELGTGSVEDPATWVSLAALSGLVVRPGSASLSAVGGRVDEWKYPGYLRAEALRSAWRVAAKRACAAYAEGEISQQEFNERSLRFELLAADPTRTENLEYLELIEYLGSARLAVSAPGQRPGLASDLGQLVASQAAWGEDELTRSGFSRHAVASVQHALVGVTLLAARDPDPYVREEAVRSAVHLHPDTAHALLQDTLRNDPVSEVRRAALTAIPTLAVAAPGPRWRELLGLIAGFDDAPLRLAAARLAEELP